MNITLDGFMAGPNCELDWHFRFWNDEMAEYACEQLRSADAILLGRVTFTGMSKYWRSVSMDETYPRADIAFADMMNHHHKIVFSKTLQEPEWHNSRIVKKNIRREVFKLKDEPGKNMIIYGSGNVVKQLTKAGLIDDYVFWVHPVILGKGKSIFNKNSLWPELNLYRTRTFSSGVVVLHYKKEIRELEILQSDFSVNLPAFISSIRR